MCELRAGDRNARRIGAVVATSLLLAACQEPFGVDRHDLVSDRIAALRVDRDAQDRLHPRATLVVDGKLWSDTPVDLAWFLLHATDDPVADAQAVDTTDLLGPAPVIDLGPHATDLRLLLVASFPSGAVSEAFIDVPARLADGQQTRLFLKYSRIDGVTVDNVQGPHLTVENRQTWTPKQADWVEPGAFVRWRVAGLAPDQRTRWMATGGAGTFFELDDATADWASGTLVLDDEDVEERVVGPSGWTTFAALVVDDHSHNQVVIADLSVGEPVTGITYDGRFLPADSVPDSHVMMGTLVADDDAPWGLGLTDVTPWEVQAPHADPYGTRELDCDGPTSGPLDLDWLSQGVCARADLVGHRVVIGINPDLDLPGVVR